LVVDDKNQARYRGELARGYKEGHITDDMIYADLGEVVCQLKPARESNKERNIACLTGIGTLDVAVAKIIYEKALRLNLGTYFSFF
jgi:alanine dehydrogenase